MKVKCPICRKPITWEENPYRPFCSEKCKLIDLGKWASEEYRLEGESTQPGKSEAELEGNPVNGHKGNGKTADT